MIIEVNPYYVDPKIIHQVVTHLRNGGLVVVPTDTVYAVACDLNNKKGLAALAKHKKIKLSKANFSLICKDLSDISNYVKHISRPTFKLLKNNLPGPFTFILPATTEVQKLFDSNKKEVGIRVPDQEVLQAIVEELGNPIVTTSLHNEEDEIQTYFADPYAIYEKFGNEFEIILDCGAGRLETSTIVDCTTDEPDIVRQGIGILN